MKAAGETEDAEDGANNEAKEVIMSGAVARLRLPYEPMGFA
jgi:hypothetical protein